MVNALQDTDMRQFLGESPDQSSLKSKKRSQFKLTYEHMPPVEPELDSERQTVDLDHGRNPTRHEAHVDRGERDDSEQDNQSERTLGTVQKPVAPTDREMSPVAVLDQQMPYEKRGTATSTVKVSRGFGS